MVPAVIPGWRASWRGTHSHRLLVVLTSETAPAAELWSLPSLGGGAGLTPEGQTARWVAEPGAGLRQSACPGLWQPWSWCGDRLVPSRLWAALLPAMPLGRACWLVCELPSSAPPLVPQPRASAWGLLSAPRSPGAESLGGLPPALPVDASLHCSSRSRLPISRNLPVSLLLRKALGDSPARVREL